MVTSLKTRRTGGFPPWLAYVAPFAAYVLATGTEGLLPIGYPWAYTIKVVAVAAVCALMFHDWPRFETRGVPAAVLFGVVGVVLWIGLASLGIEDWLRATVPIVDSLVPVRPAYDPFESIESPPGQWAFVVVRFFGLAALVPVVEELFWRGFLMRYLVADHFESVPIGTITPLSFATVTLFFALVHPEFIAAVVWGAGINLLYWWTRNLWACVVGHAVTNLLLGLYIVTRGAWNLW